MTDYADNFDKTYVPYEDWIADIKANGPKPMPTGMFLRYVMDKQGIRQADLEKQMGLEKGGLASSLTGNHLQGANMSAKMAHMSNMSETFWSQSLTNSALAEDVTIDLQRDASTISGKIRGDNETHADRAADANAINPLIDKSGQWRKGTFLFDSIGKVTPEWADAFSAASRTIVEKTEHANISALKLKPLIVSEMQKDPTFKTACLAQAQAFVGIEH